MSYRGKQIPYKKPEKPEMAVSLRGHAPIYHSAQQWPSIWFYTDDPEGVNSLQEFDIRKLPNFSKEKTHAEILKDFIGASKQT